MFRLLLFICFFSTPFFFKAQTTYVWNGSASTDWNTASNWTPSGIPGISDNVTILTGLNDCILAANTSINDLTITSGTLNLNSFTLTTLGTSIYCDNGRCTNGVFNSQAEALIFSGTIFDAAITATVSELLFDGGTFNNTVDCTQTGTVASFGNGGNTFNGICSFNKTGSGALAFALFNPDIFNNDVTLTNTEVNDIYMSTESYDNEFNGNITLNSSGTSGGFSFCYEASSSATMAAGKTIQIGNYTGGELLLRRFTQLGNVPMNLAFTPTLSTDLIEFGPKTAIGGDLTSFSSQLTLNTTTFSGASTFSRCGTGLNISVGGNVFNGPSTLTILGDDMRLGTQQPDTWNDDVIFNDFGTGELYIAHSSAGNIFNGNITLNSFTTSAGICFGKGAASATSTLAAGKSITTGTFTTGVIDLEQFTQLGSAPINLNLSSPTGTIFFGPSSSFGGDLSVTSPSIRFNGCAFNGATNFTKTGNVSDGGSANNTYAGPCSITNSSSSGLFSFGNGISDVFLSDVTVYNTGVTSRVLLASNSIGNVFNGTMRLNNFATGAGAISLNSSAFTTTYNCDIIVNSTSSGNITFGSSTGDGILSLGKTITVGAVGFSVGTLALKNFTQTGNTAQTITQNSGTGILTLGPLSAFNGSVTFAFPQIFLNGTTFNDTAMIEKNGATANISVGSNIFNSITTINNSGTGALRLASTSADSYNSDVTFNELNPGGIITPNYNTNCSYLGNITVSSMSLTSVIFGTGASGITTLAGGNAQTINRTGVGRPPVFSRLVINKPANDITLNTRVNISNSLTLVQGIINTTQPNVLHMFNGAATTVGNANSYINGPMNYNVTSIGLTTLCFPIGKTGDWRPVLLTINQATNAAYTYNSEVFIANAAALGWTAPPTVNVISQVHYWDINRWVTNSLVNSPTADLSGNQTVVLYYGANDDVSDPTNLTICKNTYTAQSDWFDIGGTGSAAGTGSISSTSSPSSFDCFSRFTLGNRIGGTNVLPVELLYFNANKNNDRVALDWATATEVNNDHFEVERSIDGLYFEPIAIVKAAGNGNSKIEQHYASIDEKAVAGISYYRLKQVDKSLSDSYSQIKVVEFFSASQISIYPNPSAGQIHIDVSNDYINAKCTILNNLGIKVLPDYVLKGKSNLVNLGDLPAGSYMLNVEGKFGFKTTKLVFQK